MIGTRNIAGWRQAKWRSARLLRVPSKRRVQNGRKRQASIIPALFDSAIGPRPDRGLQPPPVEVLIPGPLWVVPRSALRGQRFRREHIRGLGNPERGNLRGISDLGRSRQTSVTANSGPGAIGTFMTTIPAYAGKFCCVAHIELRHFGLHPLLESFFIFCKRHSILSLSR
jgi:hypothetical protein